MSPWPNAYHKPCRIEATPSQWQELLGKHDTFVEGSPRVEATVDTAQVPDSDVRRKRVVWRRYVNRRRGYGAQPSSHATVARKAA